MQEKQNNQIDTYWQANIRLVLGLLSIWFLVSFGFGILFVDFLDQYQFFGFKLAIVVRLPRCINMAPSPSIQTTSRWGLAKAMPKAMDEQ